MNNVLKALLSFAVSFFRSRVSLQLEILAIRHQLAVCQKSIIRPRLKPADRILWAWLSRIWSGWDRVLTFVQPAMVIKWRRRRFREHWKRLSRSGKPGRPRMAREIRDLIRRMSRAIRLGVLLASSANWPRSGSRWRSPRSRSTWSGGGSRLHPAGGPFSTITSRKQNPYVERLIGSIRRECLDHMIVLNERHLHRTLKTYFDYYHRSRVHQSLDMDCPEPRPIYPPETGRVVEISQVGGLHHRYERRAA